MKLLITALTLLALPIAAQDDATALTKVFAKAAASDTSDRALPIVEKVPAPSLSLEVRTDGSTLGMLVSSPVFDPNAATMIVANCTGETVTIPGFPLLLVPHAVILVAPLVEGQEFQIPFTGIPYDLYLQAGALVNSQILVSKIRVVPACDDC